MACTSVIVLFTLIAKSLKKKRHIYESELITIIEKDLNNFLISATENEGVRRRSVTQYQLNQLEDKLHKIFDKGILIRHLISLRKDLSGEFDDALFEFYVGLNLHERSLRKLGSSSWPGQIRGLQEVSQFNFQEAIGQVTRLLHSNNRYVRQEAQIALIKMSNETPLSFLDTANLHLSDWQKLRIHLKLNQSSQKHNISYAPWFDHPSPEVVVFMIQLSVLFNQIESITNIRNLIGHTHAKVQEAAALAIASLGDDTDAGAICQLLQTTDHTTVRLACIKALGATGSEIHCETMLKMIFENEGDIGLEAIRSIHEITGDVTHYYHSQLGDEMPDERIVSMINHVLDPLNT